MSQGLFVPPGPSVYLGQAATRCLYANTYYTPHKNAVADSYHFIRDDVSGLKIVEGGWYVNSGNATETDIPSATTWTAAIEYPVGTWTRATYGGASSGSCAPGALLETDFINVTIPKGAKVRVRRQQTSAGGILARLLYNPTGFQAVIGDNFKSQVGALPDLLDGTAYTTTDATSALSPVAIVGYTRKPSVLIIGNSRAFGQYDTCDSTGDWGEVARSVGADFGYINMAHPGEKAASFVASHARRVTLAAYVSHVIQGDHGGADLNQTGDSAATIMGYNNTIRGYFPGKTFFHSTSSPQSSSTDAWVTIANQSTLALESRRTTLNELIRASPAYFDIAAAVEVNRTGKWEAAADGTALTADGIHGNLFGYLRSKNRGAINPARIVR